VVEEFNRTFENESSQEVIIDLSNVRFIKPFGVTLLACTIYDLLRRMRKVKFVRPSFDDVHTYLNDIGFYDEFNITTDVQINPRSTSVAVKRLNEVNYSFVQSLITWLQSQLTLSQGIRQAIEQSIMEIINNVIDHSCGPFGYYINAQAYPNRGVMELSIMDLGVGIPHNLIPLYKHLRDDAEAVKHATVEGVSSRKGKGAKGMGLFMLKEFTVVNEGEMHILSYKGKYELRRNNENARLLHMSFPGTCVNLYIKIDDRKYFMSGETDINFLEST